LLFDAPPPKIVINGEVDSELHVTNLSQVSLNTISGETRTPIAIRSMSLDKKSAVIEITESEEAQPIVSTLKLKAVSTGIYEDKISAKFTSEKLYVYSATCLIDTKE
jgi:hypothetical protein